MAKEEKILSVQSKLNDRDFDDAYRIYLDNERGSDRIIGLITCGVIAVICILIMILTKKIAFLFYAIFAVTVGFAYYFVPANKKFIATNKLQFGMWRETSFYPHAISTLEIFEKNETDQMDEEEIEEATTVISTNSLTAYENARGFLFADGKIVNQFIYIPKRGLSKHEIAEIHDFAENNCSGGYHPLESKSLIDEDEDAAPAEDEETEATLTAGVCDRYYGAKKLHLYDSDGHKVDLDDEDASDSDSDEPADSHTEVMEPPEIDIEEAFEDIIADDDDTEEQ